MLEPMAGGDDQSEEWRGCRNQEGAETKWTRSKGIGKFKRTWACAKECSVECGGVEGRVEKWGNEERKKKMRLT